MGNENVSIFPERSPIIHLAAFSLFLSLSLHFHSFIFNSFSNLGGIVVLAYGCCQSSFICRIERHLIWHNNVSAHSNCEDAMSTCTETNQGKWGMTCIFEALALSTFLCLLLLLCSAKLGKVRGEWARTDPWKRCQKRSKGSSFVFRHYFTPRWNILERGTEIYCAPSISEEPFDKISFCAPLWEGRWSCRLAWHSFVHDNPNTLLFVERTTKR